MALNRSQKQDLIERYEQGLAEAQHAFVVDYKGITVNEDTVLRAQIRNSGGSYEVVKNTLALRAVEGKAMGQLHEHFQGPTAVAYIADDPVGLAKALTEFAKDVPAFEFKGGLVDGQAVDAGAIQEIAKMPSREELIGKLLYLMQSPVSRFVRCLGALPQQLVVALDQIAKKK
jgi:large subunit ribosomal protein L10